MDRNTAEATRNSHCVILVFLLVYLGSAAAEIDSETCGQ